MGHRRHRPGRHREETAPLLYIPHYNNPSGILSPDNFEHNAAFNYSQSEVKHGNGVAFPYLYKDANRLHTLEVVRKGEEVPPRPETTWNDSGADGEYPCGEDNSRSSHLFATPEENNLVARMLAFARNYGADALLAASKKLPPLIRDLEIAPF